VNGLYPRLIADREGSVAAFECGAAFRDIGTPADYLDTSIHLAGSEGDHLTGRGAEIHPTARVTRSAVWDDVKIGAGAELIDCVACDGAVIPAGARYTRCAILPSAGRRPTDRQRIESQLLIADF
jgi:NDP-sugar pyrophosphorylase family protein